MIYKSVMQVLILGKDFICIHQMQLQGRRDVESLNYVTNKIVCFPLNREFKDDD